MTKITTITVAGPYWIRVQMAYGFLKLALSLLSPFHCGVEFKFNITSKED